MRTIFLDLDGVMADFDGDFKRRTGMDSAEYVSVHGRKGMWKFIAECDNFFRNLPAMAGALEFFRTLAYMGITPIILTSCPSSDYANVARQKRQWVREWLGHHVLVLPVNGSESKPHFMQHYGDILIDDYGRNVREWNAAGGHAIQFKGDWSETLNELKRFL